jgi:hypothetical protein
MSSENICVLIALLEINMMEYLKQTIARSYRSQSEHNYVA